MTTTKLEKLRAEIDRRRKKELRARKRAFLVGFLILLFLFGKILYETFAPKPYVPPVPYQVLVTDGNNEGLSRVHLLFFRPDPIADTTSFEATTDAQGRYRLPKSRWNGDWICQARTEQGLLSQGFVGDFDPANGFVEMKPLEKIPGLVEDQHGKPLAQARLEVRHRMALGTPLSVISSDARGRFEIDHLSGSLKVLSFQVHKEGYQIKEIEVDLHSEDGLVLQVPIGRPLILKVQLPDGSPAADLEVSIPGHPFAPHRTDEDGRVRFKGLAPSKSYQPRIQHPTLTYLLPRAIHPSRKPLTVQLAEPLTLRASVMDRDGHALKGLLIGHHHGPWRRKESRTDYRGRLTLEGLPPGVVRLHFLLPGGEPAVHELLMREGMKETTLKLW